MKKTLFEQMGGTYSQVGDYLLPNITVPDGATEPIGVWGQRYVRYLKEHRKVLYMNLLTSGKLHSHLAEIDKQAEDMFCRLVKEMAEKQGVTEQLKAIDQMAWVGKMNNIRNAATESINTELIFA
ncbi:MAG: TnpV protein [Butyrivibrio sp.]|nr:TnpV protein [Butyrivibrio sp.]